MKASFLSLDWSPVWMSLLLAVVTTLVLFVLALPLAAWLGHTRSRWRPLVETLVTLPIVLPPTVLGFYLLVLLSENGLLGGIFSNLFDVSLAYSFPGLVVGSVVYSCPFMVQPLQAGFQSLSPSVRESAYVLGKSRWTTLTRVLLPNVKAPLLTALVLTFAHTLGEFGVVMMLGGNMEHLRPASVAIYQSVLEMNYEQAHVYSLILFVLSFTILFPVYYWSRKKALATS